MYPSFIIDNFIGAREKITPKRYSFPGIFSKTITDLIGVENLFSGKLKTPLNIIPFHLENYSQSNEDRVGEVRAEEA